jgi:hypothetical protein
MLPIVSPAHSLTISPEALEIANAYLETQSVTEAANKLGIPADQVSETLDRKEVRSYIDHIFLDVGFNNRFRIRNVMDTIIQKKLQELDEADVGSGKDIADLLALSHKMTMEVLDRQISLEKVRQGNSPKHQTNVQLNEFGGETKYSSLISKLIGSN